MVQGPNRLGGTGVWNEMHVWMCEMIYKEIEGFNTAHLDGLSDEVQRASVGKVRSGPALINRG